MDVSLLVIPLEVQAAAIAACPIFCDGVILFKCGEEMVGILFICAFDSEVIDSKAEDDGVGFVFKQTGCGFCGMAAGGRQAWWECVVGDSTGLR